MIAGISNSFLNLSGNVIGFLALGIYGSAIGFPIAICIPIIVMLIVGRFVYGERLAKSSYVGAIVAVISILLITLNQ